MACGLFNQPLRDFVPMVDRLKHAGRTPPNVELCTNCPHEECPENGCSDYNAIKRRISGGRSSQRASKPKSTSGRLEICSPETLFRVNRAIDALEALCDDPNAAPFASKGDLEHKLLEHLKHARFEQYNVLIDWDAVAERMKNEQRG